MVTLQALVSPVAVDGSYSMYGGDGRHIAAGVPRVEDILRIEPGDPEAFITRVCGDKEVVTHERRNDMVGRGPYWMERFAKPQQGKHGS